jgi:hypothetical protein
MSIACLSLSDDPNGLFARGFDADTLGTVIADKIRETMARFR